MNLWVCFHLSSCICCQRLLASASCASFSSGTFHTVHATVFWACECSKLHYLFPVSAENHPLVSQKTVHITLLAKGAVLGTFFLGDIMWCHSMLCCLISGLMWWNQFSSSVTLLNRKLSPLAMCCWSNSDDTSRHVFLCLFLSKWGAQWEQTFCSPKVVIISSVVWCPVPSCAAVSLTISLHFFWWQCQLSAHCFRLWCFSVDHSMADRQCLCFCL